MEKKYVVSLEKRSTEPDKFGVRTTREYFEIGPFYDPYHYRDGNRGTGTTPDKEDAFVFETRAAAEVIAALYCGRVEEA